MTHVNPEYMGRLARTLSERGVRLIGPTPEGNETPLETRELYRQQLSVLLDEGVDALQLETFNALSQLTALIGLVQELDRPRGCCDRFTPIISSRCTTTCTDA